MKPTPLFLTACAVAVIGGALGGAAIDTTPIQRAGVGMPEFMRSASFDRTDAGPAQPMLPDHYAMVTPSGRVEVAELTANGLYAAQRYDWAETRSDPVSAPDFDPPTSMDASRTHAGDAAVQADPSALPEAEQADQLGDARLINVAAELAQPG